MNIKDLRGSFSRHYADVSPALTGGFFVAWSSLMNQHDTLAWLIACGPFFSGTCIGICTVVAALLTRVK